MKSRLQKIQRLQQVQRQIHQIAEWKLASLTRRSAEIDEEQVELIKALNEDDAFHGLFVDSMARRLTRLANEADNVERAQEAQRQRVLKEARRLKTTERLTGTLDREVQRDNEKRVFQSLLETFATGPDASST